MITATIKGKSLIVELPLQEPTMSSTGKSFLVSTTRGHQATSAKVNGHDLFISANVYYMAKNDKK